MGDGVKLGAGADLLAPSNGGASALADPGVSANTGLSSEAFDRATALATPSALATDLDRLERVGPRIELAAGVPDVSAVASLGLSDTGFLDASAAGSVGALDAGMYLPINYFDSPRFTMSDFSTPSGPGFLFNPPGPDGLSLHRPSSSGFRLGQHTPRLQFGPTLEAARALEASRPKTVSVSLDSLFTEFGESLIPGGEQLGGARQVLAGISLWTSHGESALASWNQANGTSYDLGSAPEEMREEILRAHFASTATEGQIELDVPTHIEQFIDLQQVHCFYHRALEGTAESEGLRAERTRLLTRLESLRGEPEANSDAIAAAEARLVLVEREIDNAESVVADTRAGMMALRNTDPTQTLQAVQLSQFGDQQASMEQIGESADTTRTRRMDYALHGASRQDRRERDIVEVLAQQTSSFSHDPHYGGVEAGDIGTDIGERLSGPSAEFAIALREHAQNNEQLAELVSELMQEVLSLPTHEVETAKISERLDLLLFQLHQLATAESEQSDTGLGPKYVVLGNAYT